MNADAKFVAVAGLFLQPDQTNNTWRLVLTRDDLDPDKARVIELDEHSMMLKAIKTKMGD